MTHLKSFTTTLACPACSTPAQRTVSLARVDDEDHSVWEARVHECIACWRRRAMALGVAREKLRAAGELAETTSGQPTWMGAVVTDHAHDPVTGAMLSELLRVGIDGPGPQAMRLSERALGLLVTAERS
jgi:pyrroloquinoline quinone (PQQ) biosynthesis protein C